MLSSKSLIGMFHAFFWISCSISLVSILCVHGSLWINIFVMLFTQKLIHMRDDTSLVDIVVLWSPPFLFFFDSLWLRKEFGYECLFIFKLHLRTLIFGLVTSFVLPLHLIELVNRFAICEGYLFHGCWVDMLSTMSHIYRRLR